jgi:fatty-acyl-CoA synthase
MHGLMQDWPLTLDKIIDYAAARHGRREIVSRPSEGPITRTTYAQIHSRARQLSSALVAHGIVKGDRVATLAFNSFRHLEAWYGIAGIGAVYHTLNPRLHIDQITWIMNHAKDRILFVDPSLVPLMLRIVPMVSSIERVVVLDDEVDRDLTTTKPIAAYEKWIESASTECAWGSFDENTAAGLCYTSGTTGDPKGVLYSHRSNFLHTLMTTQPDLLNLSALDTILPVVPMFHANAWGLAFSAPAVGAKLVMPGSKLDGPSIYELLETERVTFSAAVPTVWLALLQHMEVIKQKFSSLKRVVIGGAACPESVIRRFRDTYGVDVFHAWGMTEMSPVGTYGTATSEIASRSFDEQLSYLRKQGRPPVMVEMKLIDDDGKRVAEDGESLGHIVVRGPAVTKAYMGEANGNLASDGFFDTGDIGTIDEHGFMQITDRAKDVIKSGGEWISSIEIETIAVGHSTVKVAAVIGMPHPKWGERPLLIVELKSDLQKTHASDATKAELLQLLASRMEKWCLPDDVVFVEAIPLGPTGKIDKKVLRRMFADYKLPTCG